jgi:signal transduction histidine kinase
MSTIQAAEQLVFAIADTRFKIVQFMSTGDRLNAEALPDTSEQIEHWLTTVTKLADDENEQALTARIREGYQRYLAAWKQWKTDTQTIKRKSAVPLVDLVSNDLLAPAQDLLTLEEQLIRKSGDANQAMALRVAIVLVLLGVSGAVAGLVAGFGLARSISHSIVNLYLPIRAASGRLEEVIGPVDISPATEIKHLDIFLRRMADHVGTVVDRLRQSEHDLLRGEQMAALGQLAAGLAHELRNPLTTMKLLVQAALAAGGEIGLHGRDLAVVAAETARLEKSIQTFLDFARPPRLEKQCKDIGEAIGLTLDLVSARAGKQGVEIERDIPPKPIMIAADHELLHQVFLNLAINALDAMPRGGTLRVGVHPLADTDCADAEELISISFADTGPGIPVELGDRIFEPYVSSKDTGLGLGLAICRQIVDAHSGQIFAANSTAGGAVFTVRLPIGLEKESSCQPS